MGGVAMACSISRVRRGRLRFSRGFAEPLAAAERSARRPRWAAAARSMDAAGLTLKLLLVGDSAVGKSSLLLRFTDGAFEPSLKPTVGVDFKVKKMVVDGHAVQLAIWPDREVERKEGLQFARKRSLLFIETSAKTQDGVQHAFEELVIKILQTPGLWDKSAQKRGVQLMESSAQQDKSLCGAYCPLS